MFKLVGVGTDDEGKGTRKRGMCSLDRECGADASHFICPHHVVVSALLHPVTVSVSRSDSGSLASEEVDAAVQR